MRAPRGAAEMLLGTAPQRRGAAAHALLAAAGNGGAGGARWDGVVAKGTVRICVDGTWVAAPCPPEEMRSGAAVARGVLRFLAGLDGGGEYWAGRCGRAAASAH